MKETYYLNIVCKQTLKQIYSLGITQDEMEWITSNNRRNESKKKYRFRIFEISGLVFFIISLFIIPYVSKLENKVNFLEESNISLKESLQKKNDELYLNHLIGTYITYKGSNEINDSLVYNFIKQTKAWYPEIVYAQYKIESASGTSKIFKESNNLFGMKKVYKRNTTQIPNQDYNSYGIYHNWQCSILDRVLWDNYVFKEKPSKEEYLNSLKIYAEDPDYINKINKIIKL